MRISGAIFDLDGTLLDSMALWEQLGERYLRAQGMQPRENLADTFRSMTLAEAARYYQRVYGVRKPEQQIIWEISELARQAYAQELPLKPGAGDFIRALHAHGVRLCVATATERPRVEAALMRCGILQCFSAIFTCGEVGCGKDRPHIYEAALTHLGTAREETVVFEDALYALQTAKKAGFPTAAVFDPYEPAQEQLASLADVYLTSFEDEEKTGAFF